MPLYLLLIAIQVACIVDVVRRALRRLLDEVEHRLKRMDRHQRAPHAAMYDWAMAELPKLRT